MKKEDRMLCDWVIVGTLFILDEKYSDEAVFKLRPHP
jgi:hypothetical protein